MASEIPPRPQVQLLTGVALLVIGSTAAGLVYPSPRALVLCLLALVPAAVLIWHGLRRLTAILPKQIHEGPIGPVGDHDVLQANLQALEMRLEHAPIALFRIDTSGPAERIIPLNNNARRVTAPGRASDLPALYARLLALPGGQRSMLTFDTEQGVERALVSVSTFTLQGQANRLLALMPVESELEAAALEAWRELVHVLTHEIMNSLTPVASLSLTAHELLDDLRAELPEDAARDLSTALSAISRRAHSLANFVASYRSLSNMPAAKPERVELASLFERIEALVGPGWRERGGKAAFSVEPATLEARLDSGQLEQALINLIKNAADATTGQNSPEVTVTARLSRGGRLRIDVFDNGPGVPDELIGQIFTPFFSTKEKGSGIGLAMVRQLVHANGGTVRYAKPLRGGARFVVTF